MVKETNLNPKKYSTLMPGSRTDVYVLRFIEKQILSYVNRFPSWLFSTGIEFSTIKTGHQNVNFFFEPMVAVKLTPFPLFSTISKK